MENALGLINKTSTRKQSRQRDNYNTNQKCNYNNEKTILIQSKCN